MEAVTHLEKTIAGEVTPVTHLEQVIAEYGGGNVYENLEAGTNIFIEETADGKAKISASGEVSSEDTVARAEIAAIKDGETLDSFGDVETALDDKADSSTTYTKTEVDTALGGKQNAIDSSHKLSADLVDDTSTTNKFATAAELEQIETNKNNISAVTMGTQSTGDIDLNAVTTNSYKMYTNTTSNLPTSDGSWYFVKTTVFDNNTMLQEATSMNAGAKTYTRIKRSGNWQAWKLSNLDSTQETAVNSGINGTLVGQITTNQSNILSLNTLIATYRFNNSTPAIITLAAPTSRTLILIGYLQGIGNVNYTLEIDGSGVLTVKNSYNGTTVSSTGITFDTDTKILTLTGLAAGYSTATLIATTQ